MTTITTPRGRRTRQDPYRSGRTRRSRSRPEAAAKRSHAMSAAGSRPPRALVYDSPSSGAFELALFHLPRPPPRRGPSASPPFSRSRADLQRASPSTVSSRTFRGFRRQPRRTTDSSETRSFMPASEVGDVAATCAGAVVVSHPAARDTGGRAPQIFVDLVRQSAPCDHTSTRWFAQVC